MLEFADLPPARPETPRSFKRGEQTAIIRKKQDRSSAAFPVLPLSVSALDALKFRLIVRDQRHYFADVRFKDESLPERDRELLVAFLEGRCLEDLDSRAIAASRCPAGWMLELRAYITELQKVFCA